MFFLFAFAVVCFVPFFCVDVFIVVYPFGFYVFYNLLHSVCIAFRVSNMSVVVCVCFCFCLFLSCCFSGLVVSKFVCVFVLLLLQFYVIYNKN